MKARRALVTPRDDAVSLAVSRRGDDFSAARAKETKARLESYAEDMKQPCKWVRKLIDPSVSWSDQTRRWGVVVFRDSATIGDSNNDSWERFLTVMDSCVDEGLRLLKGGTAIIPTKEFTFSDGLVSESSPEILRKSAYFLLFPQISLADNILAFSESEWQERLTEIHVF